MRGRYVQFTRLPLVVPHIRLASFSTVISFAKIFERAVRKEKDASG